MQQHGYGAAVSCTPRPTTTTPEQRAAALSWMAGRLAWEGTLERMRAGTQEAQAPAGKAA